MKLDETGSKATLFSIPKNFGILSTGNMEGKPPDKETPSSSPTKRSANNITRLLAYPVISNAMVDYILSLETKREE